jgi:hypothetical protein
MQKILHNIGFSENANFFAENFRKSQKNCDYNTDPWSIQILIEKDWKKKTENHFICENSNVTEKQVPRFLNRTYFKI